MEKEVLLKHLKILNPDAPTQPPTDGHGSWNYGNYSSIGMFKNGLWNGLIKFTWAGKYVGHRYVGNFVNGQHAEEGAYYFLRETTHVGTSEDDDFCLRWCDFRWNP